MPKRSQQETGSNSKPQKQDKKAKVIEFNEDESGTIKKLDKDELINAMKQVKTAKKTAINRFVKPDVEFNKSNEPEYLVYHCTKCIEKIMQGLKSEDHESTSMSDAEFKNHHLKRQLVRACKEVLGRGCWGENALTAVKENTLDQVRVGQSQRIHFELFMTIVIDGSKKKGGQANKSDGSELLTSVMLNFVKLPYSHSTVNMATAVVKTLNEYNIHKKPQRQRNEESMAEDAELDNVGIDELMAEFWDLEENKERGSNLR
ncbi:hypothetical protein F5878DRAFT_645116 [Lentinula raphanica]|uniref:Uncharacterized protein n=1 Tax=Lentinula raphanica TaxID=153919 RepID=A0AA38P1F3_9AGAR|nr:hypothetical protein F5878DRAFT_645116 [Lentinula raphanica]